MNKNKNKPQKQKSTNVITSIKTKMKMKTKVHLVKNAIMKTTITCSEWKKCSECEKWMHYECNNLPPYMLCSLNKGRRKQPCQNCVDNDK